MLISQFSIQIFRLAAAVRTDSYKSESVLQKKLIQELRIFFRKQK